MAALAGTYLLSLARGCHIVRRSLHGGLSQGSINFKHLRSTSLHERRRFICRDQLRANHTRLFGIRAMSTEAESAANNPGLCETPDEATKAYFMQQTMYRIKDPKISLDFYTRVLGMTLLKRLDFPDSKFSLYFLGYENPADAPKDTLERVQWTFSCKATIELTHNWGTESDPDFKGYHNGNSDPRGFGHIGITVDDTYMACERFEKLGVQFVKKPDEGRMKGLAFIKDPDGYWIEIFDVKGMGKIIDGS